MLFHTKRLSGLGLFGKVGKQEKKEGNPEPPKWGLCRVASYFGGLVLGVGGRLVHWQTRELTPRGEKVAYSYRYILRDKQLSPNALKLPVYGNSFLRVSPFP